MEDEKNRSKDHELITKLRGTEEILNLKQICRVCLGETNENDHQLDTSILLLNHSQKIRSLLEESTGVQIVDSDFLPDYICDKCLKALRTWFTLRSQTQRSNEILEEYLKKLRTSLDDTSLSNNELTIQKQDEKLNLFEEQNMPQIQDSQVSIEIDELKVLGSILHCDSSEMTLTNNVGLDKHQEEQIKQKSFKCEDCPKSFAFHNDMQNHMALFHPDWKKYKFQCDVCEKSFDSRTSFKKHKSKPCVAVNLIKQCKTRQLDVRKKQLIKAAEKAIDINKRKKISCILCKEIFKGYKIFTAHFPKYHKERKCPICYKDFINAYLLESHLRLHLRAKVYTCLICSRSFYSFPPFRKHVREHGKREWVYRCYMCKKEFLIDKEFSGHMVKHFEAMEDEKRALEKVKHNEVSAVVEIGNDNRIEVVNECDSNTLAVDDSKNEATNETEAGTPNFPEPIHLVKVEGDFEVSAIEINDSKKQLQLKETDSQVQSSSLLESEIPIDHGSFNQACQSQSTDCNQFTTNTKLEKPKEVFVFEKIVKLEDPTLDNSSSEEEIDDETDDDISTLSKLNDQISENQSAYRQEPLDECKVNYQIPGSQKEKCSNLTEIWKELLDRCMVNCHIPGCQKKCSSFNKIWKHFEKKHLSGKKPYKCSMCFKKFNTEKSFRLHIKKYYLFQCPICSKFKPNSYDLKRHVITHSFECPKCLKKFASFQYLKAHEITHTDEKQSNESKQQLQVINIKSPIPEHSSSHLESDTQRDQEYACVSQSVENNPSNTNATESKSEVSVGKDIVKLEIPTLDNTSDEEEIDDETDNDISALSKSNDQIIENRSTENTQKQLWDKYKVNCHVSGCQTKVSTFSNIWQHFKKVHLSGKKPYTCSMCFELFGNRKLMRSHINKYYSYQCPVCKKYKPNYSELKNHMIKSHYNERPFKCSKCGKKFGRRSYLEKHNFTHIKKKTFNCSICPKAFHSKNGLNLHSKSHKVIKELQCLICKKQYASNCYLKRHISLKSCGQKRETLKSCFGALENENNGLEEAKQNDNIEIGNENASNTLPGNDSKNESTNKMKTDVPNCLEPFLLIKVEKDSERDEWNKPQEYTSLQVEMDFSIETIDSKQQLQLIETESQVNTAFQLEPEIPTYHENSNKGCQFQNEDSNGLKTNGTEVKSEISVLKDVVRVENPTVNNASPRRRKRRRRNW